jgi:hypothetical protein
LIGDLPEIQILRNTVVHTGNTSDDDDNLEKFIDRLGRAHKWIVDAEEWQKSKNSFGVR